MLLQIRDYLRQAKIASNQQIARAFGLSLDALQPMLDLWFKRGVIAICHENVSCKKRCLNCAPPVYYRIVLS